MAMVFTTRRVRDILKKPASVGPDLIVLAVAAGIAGALFTFGKQVAAPYHAQTQISLSLWVLPKYTMFSLARGFAAYALSLIFTLVYGTVAAHNHRAEKVMVPALDVLQSIPVLGFLPAVVLAMIAMFPTREIGLEIACVVMIFTAQVWNMTFSYFGSIRSIPTALKEAATMNQLSKWQIFTTLELPASMIGLVWNSMMSFAGGWFVLSIEEAFQLGDKNFSLPGIGSYMKAASDAGDSKAMIAAVVAMIVMIVAVDQLFWRPIVVWSDQFKVEETAESDKAQSWVLNLLQRSDLYTSLMARIKRMRQHPDPGSVIPVDAVSTHPGKNLNDRGQKEERRAVEFAIAVAKWAVLALLAVGTVWGAAAMVRLLKDLPIRDAAFTWQDPALHADWAHVLLALLASFGRTTASVLLGAAWALPAGILIGLSPKWSQRLQPIVQVVASFPAPMIYGLITGLLVYLRIGFTFGCISLMLLGTQWYILFNVIAGAMAIPTELKEVAQVYHTPWWRQWMRIYIPGVFPYLVTGLITAAGGAWNATIVSEYVQVKAATYRAFGLGSLISDATNNANFPLLAAAIVTMAISVVILNRFMWRRLYRVAENRYALNV
jgi:NitT/TauT family transport system permease protein